jgi:3alpha(or 20beta)-hydroxysteroid dehydrogenase
MDGLVNNAGILRLNDLAATPLAEFQEVVQVNQVGTFLGMRSAVPALEAAGGGTIVNTASYVALTGMTGLTSYAASKAAVLGMTRVAALELAGKGIRVNAMCPGAIDTPMSSPGEGVPSGVLDELYGKFVPLARIGRPEEVARLALFLTSEDSSYVTGQPFVIDGGLLAGVSIS